MKPKLRKSKEDGKPVLIAVVLEGGLVRGVISDSHNVRAAVLDLDIRDACDDEVVSLECGADTLIGVPCKTETLTMPAFLKAFFDMIETGRSKP